MAGESSEGEGSLRTIACFFTLGSLVLLYKQIFAVATQDILTGSDISSSTVAIAGALPAFATKLAFPWFASRFSYLTRTVAVVLFQIGGLLAIVLSSAVEWRLVGVAVVVVGHGLGEITFFALTSFYENVATSAFAAGVGMGSVLGPLWYTAMTTWTCVSPRTAIASSVPLLLLLLASFVLLPKDHLPERERSEIKYEGRSYSPLDSTEDSDDVEFNTELSWKEMFLVVSEIYALISFQFLVYYASSLTMNAVVTTLAFFEAPFSPRDHYQYYALTYNLGKFLGRCYVLPASFACPTVVPYIRVRKIWILALMECLHLLFLVMASWFHFFSSVWIVVVLCFTEGVIVGSIYVNSAYVVYDEYSSLRQREFALSLLTVGNDAGFLTAGFMGLYLEPQLKSRCSNNYGNEQYCLTRASFYSNKQCK